MNYAQKTRIRQIRGFNRFYTNVLGLLDQHILDSSFSLSEVRVLHEIEKTEGCTSRLLAQRLCMDSGYLSRIIRRFEKEGMIVKTRSEEDGRAYLLEVTEEGRRKMQVLNHLSDVQIGALIAPLSESSQQRLADNMLYIEEKLDPDHTFSLKDISVRNEIRSGDAGRIIQMHGTLYHEEYDYTTAFEAYVAASFYEFLLDDPMKKDRIWIAEHHGEIVGCIGIIDRQSRAQLRWFLIHPDYRGIGLGKHLLEQAVAYCREQNFESVYLDTTEDLDTAIALYTRAGFVKVQEKENHSWKENLLELEYELRL